MEDKAIEKNSQHNRFLDLDVMKGIAIILMVLGHSNAPFYLQKWIYLFHMPVFFMISGYLWNSKHSDNIKSCFNYMLTKIRRLYLPFALCGSIFIIFTNLFIKLNIYTNDPVFLTLTDTKINSFDHITEFLTFGDMVTELIKCITFTYSPQLAGAAWFLQTLFIVSVFHCFFVWIIKSFKLNFKKELLIYVLLFFICIISSWIVELKIITIPGMIDRALVSYPLYLFGVLIRFVDISRFYSIVCGTISFLALLGSTFLGSVSLNVGKITNPLFITIVALSGWIMMMSCIKYINLNIKKFFSYIGKNTIPIVLLHFLSMKLVTFIYLVITNQNIVLLASFPTLSNGPIFLFIIYTVAGVSLPLLLNILYLHVKPILENAIRNNIKKRKYSE